MPAQQKSKKRTILISLLFVSIFLAIANIIAAASVSNTGEKLRELEDQSRELRHQNQLLEQKLVANRSLTKLQHQAKDLGFIEKPQMIMLSDDATVAHVIDSREL